MKLNIAVLAGDGIGPEVTAEATNILRATAELGGHEFTFTPGLIGGVAITQAGSPLPQATIDLALASDAVLLGAVGDPQFNALSPDKRPEAGLLQIRQLLGGFANLRPSVAYAALSDNSPLRPEVTKGADILFVRELLGGLYFGAPRWWLRDGGPQHDGEAINTMRYTRAEVTRVAHIAFELAAKRRGKVTSVDKANVLEVSQLWRAVVTEVAQQYPVVTLEHQLVDSMAMHLMNTPRNFDVVLTENLFGDILSDEAAVITGSLGMLPSATIGGKVNLYEPVHGSAPDIAGTGKANPLGAILTAAMLLRHLRQLEAEAEAIEKAVRPGAHRRPSHRGSRTRRGKPQRRRLHQPDGQARPPGPEPGHGPSAVHARRLTCHELLSTNPLPARHARRPHRVRHPARARLSPANRRHRRRHLSARRQPHRLSLRRERARSAPPAAPPVLRRELMNPQRRISSTLALLMLFATARVPARAQLLGEPAIPAKDKKQKKRAGDLEWLWQYSPPPAEGREHELIQDPHFHDFLEPVLHRPAVLLGPARRRPPGPRPQVPR